MKTKDEIKKIAMWMILILFSSFILLPSSFALATPRQQDVLRSIGDDGTENVDTGKLLLVVFGIVTVLIVIAMRSQRQQKKAAAPKALNHQGKLVKEVVKHVNLKPAEIKQLKILSESKDLSSPLVLLLCPSLLTAAVKENSGKIDRQVIIAVARKLAAK